MSMEVANETELLGQFASNRGYSDLIKAATSAYPALRSLVKHGASEHVPAVIADLDKLIGAHKRADVVSTAKALKELIAHQDLIVITNGEEP